MNFTYDKATQRIATDDPEVWVEDCGITRERGRGFVLHFDGKKIGFREPDSRDEFVSGKGDSSLTWTIGDIGDSVLGWDDAADTTVWKVFRYRFCDSAEQERVVELIRNAMSAYTGVFDKGEISAVHVSLSSELQTRLASGELIVE
jgi:hypothetical protein